MAKSKVNKKGANKRLLLFALLFALLAGWFGWNGWQQLQESQRRASLIQKRDAVISGVQQIIQTNLDKLNQQAASPEMQAAVESGDTTAVVAAVKEKWSTIESVELLPLDLPQAYTDPVAFGYGKLALMESAVQENTAVARTLRDGDVTGFGLAVPVKNQILYVRLPIASLTVLMNSAAPDETYLALRQGTYNIREVGDPALSSSADALAQPIGTTGLRVMAGISNTASAMSGLTRMQNFIVAGLLLLLAMLSAILSRGNAKPLDQYFKKSDNFQDDGPTLGQTLGVAGHGDLFMNADPNEPLSVEPPPEMATEFMSAREMPVDPGIFRAYDIRGVVGETLDVSVAALIGQSIGSVMAERGLKEIVVGRDGRLSGPELSDGLIRGLRKAGRDVIDIGMVPTPVAYFASSHLRAGSCVAVTGSHNPPDYNGFKIVIGGETLSGERITDLYNRISDGQLTTAEEGGLREEDVVEDYIQKIAKDVQLARPLKVVVDAGNGVAGDVGPMLLEALGATVVPLYCEIDGTFPNHHPDPSEPKNLKDLEKTVKHVDADLGLAFDGDGDRLGVVTRDGQVIFPDRLLMLYAADVLERNPGSTVIYDVKCTGKLQNWILRYGGTPQMWKTGHSLIKAKMRETGAELAGEMSGHFFFQERWYGFDDGLYAAARLLEILSLREESPSEVLEALPDSISTPELKVDVPDGDAHAIVKKFAETAKFEGARLTTIDGLRADWSDGWGLVRASNTTPILVLRFEADNQEALDRIREAFRQQLRGVAPTLALNF